MTLKRWYQFCLILPILVPLFFGLLCWLVTGSFSGMLPAPRPEAVMPFMTIPLLLLSNFTAVLLLGLYFSCIPYFLFAVTMLWVLRYKDAVYWGRISYLMPLFFFPYAAVAISLMMGSGAGVAFAFFTIPYGYLYVFLAHMLTWAALKSGKVVDTLL